MINGIKNRMYRMRIKLTSRILIKVWLEMNLKRIRLLGMII